MSIGPDLYRASTMDGQGMGSSFLPRLEATFLAIFHPVDGPKVLFQMPEDSFLNHDAPLPPQAASQRRPMLDFSSLSDYVIPKAPLCGRLITCEVRSHSTAPHSPRSYKVMGFPVLLQQAEKYQRNNFIFNLCFVFDSRANVSAYEPIVRKCGRSLRLLEVRRAPNPRKKARLSRVSKTCRVSMVLSSSCTRT